MEPVSQPLCFDQEASSWSLSRFGIFRESADEFINYKLDLLPSNMNGLIFMTFMPVNIPW